MTPEECAGICVSLTFTLGIAVLGWILCYAFWKQDREMMMYYKSQRDDYHDRDVSLSLALCQERRKIKNAIDALSVKLSDLDGDDEQDGE